ncbi:imidazole glycerol phosphate synthase subunit HisH [Candidatus Micrarchaeota archaeon]|nr:imidazole glycerol phosphate synthase subunit HisH [Candidatus Micrarchaeota archaeon]
MKTVAIIDYDAGNVASVANAVKKVGGRALITRKAGDVEAVDAIILPGVGSFELVKNLEPVKRVLLEQMKLKPFLGICLGLQALFDSSGEAKDVNGLGVFSGSCRRLRGKVKIPQIGWNQVKFARECALFEGVADESFFYFDHSFAVVPKEKKIVCGETDYGQEIVSAVARGSVFGVQFHPEKSGKTGLKVLGNFLEL